MRRADAAAFRSGPPAARATIDRFLLTSSPPYRAKTNAASNRIFVSYQGEERANDDNMNLPSPPPPHAAQHSRADLANPDMRLPKQICS